MKPVAYAAVLLGLVSAAMAQDPGPSPTESYGCEPHGDHWHCEGPRVTLTTGGGAATTAAAVTTSAATHTDHDEDHDHGEDHTDAAGTGSLAPSPTESYGCEPHGDHWHCEGPRTALSTGLGASSGSGSSSGASTTSTTSASTASSSTASTSPSPSTAGAAHYEAAGLGFAGMAAIVAMAL